MRRILINVPELAIDLSCIVRLQTTLTTQSTLRRLTGSGSTAAVGEGSAHVAIMEALNIQVYSIKC